MSSPTDLIAHEQRKPRSGRSFGSRLPRPHSKIAIIVVIPVRNEAHGIVATVNALAVQLRLDGMRLDPEQYEILLLANNCTDDTAALAKNCGQRWPHLRLHVLVTTFYNGHANVGHARRVLMDLACDRLDAVGNRDAIIASTDGDTRVSNFWLAALHAEVQAGADAVGGRIVNSGVAALPRALLRLQRQDSVYQLLRSRAESLLDPDDADPWPRHHQHFGANFAVRASAYRTVGGLPDVEYLEDEALFAALRAQDFRLRHSCQARVYTSMRRHGRAAVGLSWQLREWQNLLDQNRQPQLETAASYYKSIALRIQLRALWRQANDPSKPRLNTLLPLAMHFSLDPVALRQTLIKAKHFGALWTSLEARWRDTHQGRIRRQPMSQAIAGFRRLVDSLEPASSTALTTEMAAVFESVETLQSGTSPIATNHPEAASFAGLERQQLHHIHQGAL